MFFTKHGIHFSQLVHQKPLLLDFFDARSYSDYSVCHTRCLSAAVKGFIASMLIGVCLTLCLTLLWSHLTTLWSDEWLPPASWDLLDWTTCWTFECLRFDLWLIHVWILPLCSSFCFFSPFCVGPCMHYVCQHLSCALLSNNLGFFAHLVLSSSLARLLPLCIRLPHCTVNLIKFYWTISNLLITKWVCNIYISLQLHVLEPLKMLWAGGIYCILLLLII